MLTNKTRSLNFNQTLDELLGPSKSKSGTEQSPFAMAVRPPTRHGRESVSSSEENRESNVSEVAAGGKGDATTNRGTDSFPADDDRSEDEFLTKLNEIRRRSLVNIKDVRDNQRVRAPSEISEEAEEDPNNNSSSSKKLLSRPSTSESPHTFRITTDPGISKQPPEPPTPAPRTAAVPPRVEPIERTSTEATTSLFTGSKNQHDVWLQRKLEEERKRKEKERKAAKKKEEEEKERREQAKKLFERWKRERDEKLREERRRQREKEKEKQKREEELKKEKKVEAEKSFEAWKRTHSASRKSRASPAEKEKQRLKEEARIEAEKAFEAWKKNKTAAEIAERRKAIERDNAEKKRIEEEQEYRELLARQTYETWLEIKENERLMTQSMASLAYEEPPPLPWLPPSNTCPRQFTPSTKNRRRSLDPRPRARSAQIPRLNRVNSVKTIFSMK